MQGLVQDYNGVCVYCMLTVMVFIVYLIGMLVGWWLRGKWLRGKHVNQDRRKEHDR